MRWVFTIEQAGYIRQYGASHGVNFPCTMTAYQAMTIEYRKGDLFLGMIVLLKLIAFTVNKSDSDPDQLICRQEGNTTEQRGPRRC
jgi:hypothetical protein